MAGILDQIAGYRPHKGKPYENEYVTPGTVGDGSPADISGIVQADTPDHAHLMDRFRELGGMETLLDEIFTATHAPGFEFAGPYSAGGKSQASLAQVANATGVGSVYSIPNPWDNDAEFCIIQAAFGAAGQAVISLDPTYLGPSLSQFYDGPSLVRVLPFIATGAGTFPVGQDQWFPIPASQSLYWSVNMVTANTNSAIVTVVFRRRINRHGRYYLTIE